MHVHEVRPRKDQRGVQADFRRVSQENLQENCARRATFLDMNVSEFLANQERGLAQLAWADNYAQRRLDWENNLSRQHQRLWDMERRAAALCGPSEIVKTMEAIRPRPFDDLVSRMEEQSRGFQKLTDDLTRSAIGNALSQTTQIGETCRRLIDPIPALKSVLEPFTSAPAFDAMRYVTPLVEFERQFNALRDHSFSRFNDLRSTVFDTIQGLSRVVKLVTPYAESPPVPFPASHGDFSLGDVVDLVGSTVESSPAPDWLEVTGFLTRIEARLSALELKMSTPTFRDNVKFWLGVIGFLIGLLSLCLQFSQNNSLPDQKQPAALQSPEPSPPEADERNFAGPCP